MRKFKIIPMTGVLLAVAAARLSSAMEVPCQELLMKSVEAFQTHTESHIRRVLILGVETLRQFRGEFPGVQDHLLVEFLSLHDQSKINRTGPFLRKFGLENRKESIIESLYKMMGHWSDDPVASKALVSELNGVDAQVADGFFSRNGLLQADGTRSAVALRYLKIEEIADKVDTTLSIARGEEYGERDRLGVEKAYLKDQRDWEIARALARYYDSRALEPADHLFLKRQN